MFTAAAIDLAEPPDAMKRAKAGKFGSKPNPKRQNSDGRFGASPSSSQSPGVDTVLKEKNAALEQYADKLEAELPRPLAERLIPG